MSPTTADAGDVVNIIDCIIKPKTLGCRIAHDAGHPLTSALVYLGLRGLLDFTPLAALGLSWVLPIIAIEALKDFALKDWKFSRDSAHDIPTYGLWPATWAVFNGGELGLLLGGIMAVNWVAGLVVFYWNEIAA